MNYEIDFIGVPEHTKDALAICLRWYSEQAGRYIIVVYDGGFKIHGEALVNILKKYYVAGESNPSIDIVICSHSDDDHASGLVELFEHFRVKHLVMNRPWKFSEELSPYIDDGRKTAASVERELKEKYSAIVNLENAAIKAGTPIHDGFSTLNFYDEYSPLKILSPTKELYLQLIIESDKTPYSDEVINESFMKKCIAHVRKIIEQWSSDSLREGVSTTAENETSVILMGDMVSEKFLLTGDAGTRALTAASNYADSIGLNLKTVDIHQIPHHGSRHNVSPSVLNRVVGPIVDENSKSSKTAFVSIGKDSDHPKAMVTNAYIRRGTKVFEARKSTIHHHKGDMPEREGWSSATKKVFTPEVDDWS